MIIWLFLGVVLFVVMSARIIYFKLTTPPYTQAALLSLGDLQRGEFSKYPAFGAIGGEIYDSLIAKSNWKNAARSSDLGFSPKALIAHMTVEICIRRLMSGHCHLYRGVLLPHGLEYLRIHKDACRILVELGHTTQQEVDKEVSFISNALKELG